MGGLTSSALYSIIYYINSPFLPFFGLNSQAQGTWCFLPFLQKDVAWINFGTALPFQGWCLKLIGIEENLIILQMCETECVEEFGDSISSQSQPYLSR